jgi:DNA topoisomerase VI subunit A
MEQKKVKITERKQEVIKELKNFGTSIYNQLDQGVFPTVNMPSRSTENISLRPHFAPIHFRRKKRRQKHQKHPPH